MAILVFKTVFKSCQIKNVKKYEKLSKEKIYTSCVVHVLLLMDGDEFLRNSWTMSKYGLFSFASNKELKLTRNDLQFTDMYLGL